MRRKEGKNEGRCIASKCRKKRDRQRQELSNSGGLRALATNGGAVVDRGNLVPSLSPIRGFILLVRGLFQLALGCLEIKQQISWSLALQNAEKLKWILSSNR